MGYGKLKVDLVYSDNSDYVPDELPDLAAHTFTASKHLVLKNLALTSSGLTVDLSMFSSLKYVIVENVGTTNECYVTWSSTDAAGGAVTSQDHNVPAGSFIVLPGVTIADDIVLDCAAAETTTAHLIVLGA